MDFYSSWNRESGWLSLKNNEYNYQMREDLEDIRDSVEILALDTNDRPSFTKLSTKPRSYYDPTINFHPIFPNVSHGYSSQRSNVASKTSSKIPFLGGNLLSTINETKVESHECHIIPSPQILVHSSNHFKFDDKSCATNHERGASPASLNSSDSIGIALGSPKKDVFTRPGLKGNRMSSRVCESIPENRYHKSPRKRHSKRWRIMMGGLFSGKRSRSQTTSAFYQNKSRRPLESESGRITMNKYHKYNEGVPTKVTKSERKSGKKSLMRYYMTTESRELKPRLSLHRDIKKPNRPTAIEKSSLLNVDIPTIKMDRYSVMFSGLLNSSQSNAHRLSTKRRHDFERLKAVTEALAMKERELDERFRKLNQQTAGPQLARTSFSLFPRETTRNKHVSSHSQLPPFAEPQGSKGPLKPPPPLSSRTKRMAQTTPSNSAYLSTESGKQAAREPLAAPRAEKTSRDQSPGKFSKSPYNTSSHQKSSNSDDWGLFSPVTSSIRSNPLALNPPIINEPVGESIYKFNCTSSSPPLIAAPAREAVGPHPVPEPMIDSLPYYGRAAASVFPTRKSSMSTPRGATTSPELKSKFFVAPTAVPLRTSLLTGVQESPLEAFAKAASEERRRVARPAPTDSRGTYSGHEGLTAQCVKSVRYVRPTFVLAGEESGRMSECASLKLDSDSIRTITDRRPG
ncbi:unnamed protein product [Blumeria hordei]|uniref:Uncharacterized protein n=1 Tax=Blumeria hordei TaxID=2867405 RepID=A0A383ULR3_BLUHO|nr:unnamed protein product [Blumeria hordei]